MQNVESENVMFMFARMLLSGKIFGSGVGGKSVNDLSINLLNGPGSSVLIVVSYPVHSWSLWIPGSIINTFI